jgi:protein tyrosine phosphatase
MVWQEKSEVDPDAVRRRRARKHKCSEYWPTSATAPMQTGGLAISYLGSKRKDTAFTTTTLAVTDGGREQLHVRLHQWSSWPDHGVPQSPLAPLRMIRTAFRTRATTIVHCSAGVGRTGSIVAIEMCVRH